jgi:hypothetical protein
MSDKYVLTLPPVRCGGRSLYALIRISDSVTPYGGYGSAIPVALIIEEEGAWYYTIIGAKPGKDQIEVLMEILLKATMVNENDIP